MSFKEKLKNIFGDFAGVQWKDLDHKKVYSAAAILLAVLILVIVLIVQAVSGTKTKDKDNKAPDNGAVAENTDKEKDPAEDNPLEVNAHQEINDVVLKYFHGLSTGDIPLVEDVVDVLTEDEIQTIETKKQYVEEYQHLTCYTKKGMEEGSYVAFVSYDMKILNIDTPAPGMMPLYLRQDEEGSYYIFNDDASEEMQAYVLELAAQDDIAAIIADIQARYDQALTEDANLAEFDAKIHESQQEPSEEPTGEEPSEEPTEDPTAEEPAQEPETPTEPENTAEPTSAIVTATVRIRADRSTESELVSVIAEGTGVKVYENYEDGWSKIDYEGTVGYCKTEYLNTDGTYTPSASSGAVNKKMRLKTTVKIRSERSADSGRVATGYKSEYVQVLESYSDGWSKVEYNGKTGYCQTQYLENI